jgi:uncharacterized protein YdcH (DUF465 family)
VEAKARTILVRYLKEDKMVTGKFKKNKKLKKLHDHHQYLSKKVAELTEERKIDRSSESKALLMRLKKTKLMLKDAIAKATATLTKK